jgi:integrase
MVSYQYIRFFCDMGRRRHAIPNRLLHRPSGRDRIVWQGRSIYLGRHGSPESEAAYRKIVKSILETGSPYPPQSPTVATMTARYVVIYRQTSPETSREWQAVERAVKLFNDQVGTMPADTITPAVLIRVREAWIDSGLSVRTINRYHNMILSAFRWAVQADMIPANVWQSLQSVGKLKPMRSRAKEPRTVEPVAWSDVEAIRDHVRPQVWSMICLQWWTGMRSGELLAMTVDEIVDRTYRPSRHKNAWRGHERIVHFGPNAWPIVTEAMTGKGGSDRLFRGYTSQSYGRAIARACEAAGVPHWHPHRIRHSMACRIRERFGLDGSQAVLGHKTTKAAEIYAKNSTALAREVVDELG